MKSMVAMLLALAVIAVHEAHAQSDTQSHEPTIGGMMVSQQMRHIKLWFAGNAGNWPLANYELDALRDGFADVDQSLGGGTVEKSVGDGLSALEKAIAAKDRAAFTTAFDRLSAGCNTCHTTLDHAFIVIQRPTVLPYSDQSFAARK